MRIGPEVSEVSIVLLGRFNPPIFTPAWFELHGLLPENVAENSETEVVHPDLAVFSTEWLSLNVTQDRFIVRSLRDPQVRLRDLALRLFNEILPHTPITALGINREVHFLVGSSDERDRIGRLLAPTEHWGDWGKEIESAGDRGGMTSLTMARFDPEGRPTGGAVNVTVEPSKVIGEGRSGIFVRVNDHYVADGANAAAGRKQLMSFLDEEFEQSIRRSEGIIDHIMSLKDVG